MGVKLSKSRELFKESSPFSVNVSLPSKPYQFLNGSQVKSASQPTLVNINRKNNSRSEDRDLPSTTGSTSVAFLGDENFLVFGTICTVLDTYAIERRLYNQGLSEHDNLSIINLSLAKTQVLIDRPVRDICLSSSREHLAFLTYSGYSRLQVCPCSDTPKLNDVKIFEEKSLISHCTCCAFSPNDKWLVACVCSDYFTMRSRSHLVVRQVNLPLNKFGKGREVHFSGQNLQKHFLIGLLISLEFSPDSTLLAVGGSKNNLLIFSTETWELLSIIGKPSDRFTSLWGIFNPLPESEDLVTCTGFGRLEKHRVPKKDGRVLKEVQKISGILDICGESHTTVPCCPCFAPTGRMLAVGFSSGNVVIVEPLVLKTLWTIHPEFIYSESYLHSPSLSVSRLCFSKSCEYLAAGYSGDLCAVWSLPRSHFTLKHFCRTTIITICPPKMIPKLPIPNSLKQYLLYQL